MAKLPQNKKDILHDRIYSVPLTMIKTADYNPPKREFKRLNSLKSSIEKIGQVQPIVLTLTPFCSISEGHRRFFVCKSLGRTEINAIFLPKGINPSVVYSEVNNTIEKHSSTDTIFKYLINPMSVSDKVRAELYNIENMIGKNLLSEMYEKGYSIPTYHQSRKAIDYIGLQHTRANVTKVLKWVMEHKQTKSLREFIDKKRQPHLLFSYIECCSPIKN